MPKILVADDNTNIQKMVSLAFSDLGIEVVAVGNGEAAVRRIPDLNPDLVLADIFMPVRNGYEVCEFVKKDTRFSHIPVILLVGAFDPLDEKEARRVGADGVLKKPFVPPDPLIAMVTSALEKNPKVAAEMAKAKEVVPEPVQMPAAMEMPAKAEVKPLPEFPEPTPEEAALVYGFGTGKRAVEEDSAEDKSPKAPVAVDADEDEEDVEESSPSRSWRRNAMDFEVPEETSKNIAFAMDDETASAMFPSEKQVPPKHVSKAEKDQIEAHLNEESVAKFVSPAISAPVPPSAPVASASAEPVSFAPAAFTPATTSASPAPVEKAQSSPGFWRSKFGRKESLPAEAPKVEVPKTELAKPEPPTFAAAKVEAPTFETPKFEPPKFEAPKLEISKIEPPKIEEAPAPVFRPWSVTAKSDVPVANSAQIAPRTPEIVPEKLEAPVEQQAVEIEPVNDGSFASRATHWMDAMAGSFKEADSDDQGWDDSSRAVKMDLDKQAAIAPIEAQEAIPLPISVPEAYPPVREPEPIRAPEPVAAAPAPVPESKAEAKAESKKEDDPFFADELDHAASSLSLSPKSESTDHMGLPQGGAGFSGESNLEAEDTKPSPQIAKGTDPDWLAEPEGGDPMGVDPMLVVPPSVKVTPEPLLVDETPKLGGSYGDKPESTEKPFETLVPVPTNGASAEAHLEHSAAEEHATDERIPTGPPPNREVLAEIPFLSPPAEVLADAAKENGLAPTSSGTPDVDEMVRRVLEKLEPQLHDLLSQGVLKPLVENVLQSELAKKGK